MSQHERERLSAYLDGELPPDEMSAVAAHVAACSECAARLAEFAAVDGAAAALAANAPSGYFEALPGRMRARLEPRRSSRVRGVPAWTWAVAAALLLAVVTPLTITRRPTLAPVPEAAKERAAAAPLATAPPATQDAPLADTALPPAAAPAVVASAPAAPAERQSASGEAPAAAASPAKLHEATPPAATTRALSPSAQAAPAAPAAPPSAPAANVARPPAVDELGKREGFAQAPADAERRPAEQAQQARRDKGLPVVGGAAGAAGALSRVEPQSAPKPDADAADQQARAADAEARAKTQAAPPAAAVPERKAAAPAELETVGGRAESVVAGLASAPAYDEKDAAADAEWRRLTAAKPQTAAEWRQLREQLRRFVGAAPDGPHADAARLRTIEAGYKAWRTGGDAADEAVFRGDAAAYLKRGEDAKEKARARELFLSR